MQHDLRSMLQFDMEKADFRGQNAKISIFRGLFHKEGRKPFRLLKERQEGAKT
jgi:hypothetical protein